ncbi:Toprim-like [Ruminococcaceae bacterium YAD3003]|nr:Toprim-like [Ruminococcaceae bacterium YAD3003]
MGLIPENVIDEILTRADIESVVGRYVLLKRSGSNLWGLCPFHSEKTASFSVNPAKGIYKCFGCGKGGNAINFIMEIEHMNYPEAIRHLGGLYGVEVPETGFSGDNIQKEEKNRVKEILKEAAKYYYNSFNDEHIGKPARDYAAKRGLTKQTLDNFGLGYSPINGGLYEILKQKGYKDEEMLKSGIFAKSSKTNKPYDLFRGRFMFPIFDSFGTIIAFGGRALGDEKPKYINSPDSLVYNKQNHLYAMNFARKEQSKQLIVVEGYMDAIAMHSAGFKNTVAALGTSFTDSQLKLCSRYAEEVVFFFDADNAGQKAALRAIKMMMDYLKKLTGINIRIRIAKVPDGKDPDEYIKVNGADKFKEVVKNALYVEDYLLERAKNDNTDPDSGVLDRGRYQEDICQYGSWMNDDIKMSRMAGVAAPLLGATQQAVMSQMQRYSENEDKKLELTNSRALERERREELSKRNSAEVISEDPGTVEEVPAAEREYKKVNDSATKEEIALFAYALSLGSALSDKKIVEKTDIIRPDDFNGDTIKELVRIFLNIFDGKNETLFAKMSDYFSRLTINGMPAEDVMLRAVEIADKSSNVTVKRDMYLALLFKVRTSIIEREEERLMNMRAAASGQDKAKIDEMLRRLSDYKLSLRNKIGEL